MLRINSEYVKGILFVRIEGNLNRRNSYKLKSYLIPAILKHRIKFLVYNLYNLNDIDMVGKKALEQSAKAIDVNKGISLICEVPPKLNEFFQNVNITKTSNELTAIKTINI
ncbi:MAG TPA: STAS domain-containing protein [Bacilli bacterium]|jgi:STAS domain|nr:STAS domain-containing protein [Bacilli bacterium]